MSGTGEVDCAEHWSGRNRTANGWMSHNDYDRRAGH